jgi:tRNA nucleotidyltransferase (CCA-adding enzyme)
MVGLLGHGIIEDIATAVQRIGGRALLVGGCVRDTQLGLTPKDLDLEIHGLDVATVKGLLGTFGTVKTVGEAFGVFLLHEHPGLDISIPRRDNTIGTGHRDFDVTTDPHMSIEDAAVRRDFTMNSMAYDLLTGELFDFYGGMDDLRHGLLRVTDPITFIEDPLRAMRAAQFCARFDLTPTGATVRLIQSMDLSSLSGERLFAEFEKLLLSKRPGLGLTMMYTLNLLRFFPEIKALLGVEQEPEWHPEGDVFTHTVLALDSAVLLRTHEPAIDRVLMWAVLTHDFGKPSVTAFVDGRWRSRGHEDASEVPVRSFFGRMGGVPQTLVDQCVVLAEHHLAPAQYTKKGSEAGSAAYRRLARKLNAVGLTVFDLHRVSTADQFGRTTLAAQAKQFPAGDDFLVQAILAGADKPEYKDVVLGRHLLALGYAPGPHLGPMLARCREVQIEDGLTNVESILIQAGIVVR